MNPAAAPRLPPLERDQWDEEAAAAIRAGFGSLPADQVPNAVSTMLHHPRLAGRFLKYNAMLLTAPALEPRWRELLILRVAWRTGAPYEWLQHVRIARRLGITDDEIAAVADGSAAPGWGALEADLVAAADQLLAHYRIDDATWSRLAAHLNASQLVEVVFVVGTYTLLAMAFNSFGVPLDADLHDVAPPVTPPTPGT